MATNGGVLIKALISQLADDGEKAIREAYEGREFTNRTYNLHDSYGSAVYYNGTLVKGSIRYVGAEMAEEDDRYGRNEVNDFFANYRPKNRKGIDLVIVAAMFYADILEGGKGRLKRKYKVIAEGEDYMKNVATHFRGTLSKFVKPKDL